MTDDATASPRLSTRTTWVLLTLILLASAALRLNLLDVPLERDEGEYAYAAQRIAQGDWLYRDIYTMKLPGTHVAYTVILKIFGQSARGIHLGLLLLIGLNQGLIFAIGRRLFGSVAGLSAAAAFGLLLLSPSVVGSAANTEPFVLAPALAGILLSLRALSSPHRWTTLGAGLCFGLAILMKQHGAVFGLAAAVTVVAQARASGAGMGRALRTCGWLALGAAIPLLLTLVLYATHQSVGDLFFWSIQYSLRYVSGLDPELGWHFFKSNFGAILLANPAIWLLALVGLIALPWRGRSSLSVSVLAPLTILSALAVSPGLYFRPHYFVLALPAIALLFGLGLTAAVSRLPSRSRTVASLGVLMIVALASVAVHREVLFEMDPNAISRSVYGTNPFPESPTIARELANRTSPDDTIAVVGSEPQILFLAQRKSATSFIYTYPMMESHSYARAMQDEMIAQIESERPKLLVFVNVKTSWLATPSSDQHILQWAQRYWSAHYERAGVIELAPNEPSRFRWGKDVVAPRGNAWIMVFERRSQG